MANPQVNRQIEQLLKNNSSNTYSNIKNGVYEGWVSNFNIYKKSDPLHKKKFSLDLTNDDDLFLLFVLASAWSRTGQYENSLYFILFLRDNGYDTVKKWKNMNIAQINNLKVSRQNDALNTFNNYIDIRKPDRKPISFRDDFYDSVKILADHWKSIKTSLGNSENKNDYSIFINFLRGIPGLGSISKNHKRCMRIKIPLILRELRATGGMKNIPGEWCCVPDDRVINKCAPALRINLKPKGYTYSRDLHKITDYSMRNVIKMSEIIYDKFGDLYDIPLFAYEDLDNAGKNQFKNILVNAGLIP